MLVDEIFAMFLFMMSITHEEDAYKKILHHLILYRECLNQYGWTKRIEGERIDLKNNPELASNIKSQQYCLVNTAEHAPAICNEFVSSHTDYNISQVELINLTVNLCEWLYDNNFTASKLTT